MCPATAATGIIPVKGASVKVTMLGLLDGLSVVSADYAVSLLPSITSEEFALGIQRLEGVERQVMVRSRFKRGDMWDQMQTPAFCAVRLQWLAGVKVRIPDPEVRNRYLKTLSSYGAVAARWPADKRTDGHCWSYYRDNGPGGKPVNGGVDAMPYFKSVRNIEHEGEVWLECAGRGDRRVVVGLSPECLEAIRTAMGWVASE